MSLFNKIATATGGGAEKYAKHGRHLVRLTKVFFIDPSDAPAGSARTRPLLGFKGVLLHSNRSDFGTTDGFSRGDEITVNDGCAYLDSALARLRRGLAAAKQSAEGLANCDEATLGLVQGKNETDKEFRARVVAEAERLCGPEQPLVGAYVTFDCTEKVKKDGSGRYTLFEVRLPNDAEMELLAADSD